MDILGIYLPAVMAWFKAHTPVLAVVLAATFTAWGYLFYQHAQMNLQAMNGELVWQAHLVWV